MLSVAGFAAVVVMRMIDPLLPVLAAEFSVSIGRASLIIAAYSLPYGLCVLLYGPLGDRIGKLRVILAAMGLSALCITLCGFSRTLDGLLLWRFLTGACGAAIVPLSLAFIGALVPLQERQSALARYISGVVLGQIVGSGIGGVWADQLGWRSLFWAYGGLTALVTLIVWMGTRRIKLPPQQVSAPGGAFGRYRAVFATRKGREVMLAVFLEGMLLFGGTAFLGALLNESYGLNLTAAGLMLMCVGLGSLCYTLSVRWLIRHLGPRRMIALGGLLMTMTFFALVALHDWQAAAPILVLLGLAIYLMHNTLQTLATELIPEARGTAVSMMAFVLFAGQAIGAWGLGLAIDHFGYAPSYAVTGLALLVLGAWLQGTRVVKGHAAGAQA